MTEPRADKPTDKPNNKPADKPTLEYADNSFAQETDEPGTRYCYAFENLFSTLDEWTFRLLLESESNSGDHEPLLLAEQTGLASETSKLLIFSGTQMINYLEHNHQYFAIEQLRMLPRSKRVEILAKSTNPVIAPEMIETYAQRILCERPLSSLSGPAVEVLTFIRLNDQLFNIDPAHLIFLVEEAQYDEYNYLAAMILHGLLSGLHPERVILDTFEKMGLGGRCSHDDLDKTLKAIDLILEDIHESSPLTDTLLHDRPDLFTYGALLQPTLSRIAPSHDSEATDLWDETFDFIEKILTGQSLEETYRCFLQNPAFDPEEMEEDAHRYALSAIRQTLESAKILFNSRSLQAVIHPEQQEVDSPANKVNSPSPVTPRSRFDIFERLRR